MLRTCRVLRTCRISCGIIPFDSQFGSDFELAALLGCLESTSLVHSHAASIFSVSLPNSSTFGRNATVGGDGGDWNREVRDELQIQLATRERRSERLHQISASNRSLAFARIVFAEGVGRMMGLGQVEMTPSSKCELRRTDSSLSERQGCIFLC